MTREEKLLLFLGKIQGRIEDLGQWAAESKNPVFNFIADLENYFNKSLDEILSIIEEDSPLVSKGITWKTLPR